MDMTLKRVLTRKSILGFGYSADRHLSVQMLLDMGKRKLLISSYYGLQKIDFADDVLNELGITEEYRIPKPGKDNDMKKKFYTDLIPKIQSQERTELDKIKEAASVMKEKRKNLLRQEMIVKYKENKGFLKAVNEGHFRKK